jgi:serine/threonine-protein kinase
MALKKIGRYEIKGEIGTGGMSTVYQAYDPRFDREIAIKVLPSEFMHTSQFRERFEREARFIASLEHPAIVPVYDFGEESGMPYIIMRYMSGGSLADKLEKGPLPLSKVIQIFTRLAPALDAAHAKGIIHRDLKPGNILFDHYDNAFLSDFGIARLTHPKGPTLTGGVIIGTPAYMSPERIQGDRKEIGSSSDLYSMGVILYHMLTGDVPYQSDNPAKIMIMHIMEPVPNVLDKNPYLPPAFEFVVKKSMAKSPTGRYATTVQMAEAIRMAAKNSPAQYTPTSVVLEEGEISSSEDEDVSTLMLPPDLLAEAEGEGRYDTDERQPIPILQRLRALPRWAWITGGIVTLFLLAALIFGGGLLGPELPTPSSPTTQAVVLASPQIATTTPTIPPTLTPPPAPVIGGADKIAFLERNNLWISDLDGSNLERLTTDSRPKSDPQWAPDGDNILYISDKCIWQVNVSAQLQETLACFNDALSLQTFEISPDGRQVAIILDQSLYLVAYDPARLDGIRSRAELNELALCPSYAPYRGEIAPRLAHWSPDGERLALSYQQQTATPGDLQREVIGVFDVNGCRVELPELNTLSATRLQFTLPGYFDNPIIPGFAWDGQDSLVVSSPGGDNGFGELVAFSLGGAASSPLVLSDHDCCFGDQRWSPDRRYLLLTYLDTESRRSQLYYLSYDGAGNLQVTAPIPFPEDFFTNPDRSPQPVLRPAQAP